MKLKKAIGVMLLTVIVLTQFSGFTYARDLTSKKSTRSASTSKWHYEQITSKNDAISKTAKVIYEAMEEMANRGDFKRSANVDIAGKFSQEEITKYLKGDSTLKEAMNAAKYAFYADHPEIFYVNFSKLTLRVTQEKLEDGSIKYHAYIGAGARSNYYTEAFNTESEVETAINEFNEKVDSIVNSEEKPSDTTDIKALIKYAHNEVIYNADYTYETDLTEAEKVAKYNVGSPYGILVKGKGVCEGYARALKTILDRLEIKSILVQGFHSNSEDIAIEHMWNYVQFEGKWYAVDCTLDDPFVYDAGGNKVGGFENTGYLLVGRLAMSAEHTAIGKVEAAGGYEFIYPELNEEDEGVDKASEVIVEKDQNRILLVKYKKFGTEQTDDDGNIFQAGDFYISYNGQNATEIRNKRQATQEEINIFEQYKKDPLSVDKKIVKDVDENGMVDGDDATYILMRESQTRSEGVIVGDWAYFLPDEYSGGLIDHQTTESTPGYTFMSAPHIQRLEFAITKVPPTGYLADNIASLEALHYQGKEEEMLATSGWLDNPTGTYIGRPYVLKQTPDQRQKLSIGNNYTFDVEATFTDNLVEKVEEKDAQGRPDINYIEPEGEVTVSDEEILNWVKLVTTKKSAVEHSKITNFKWDGKNKVSFKIEVSKMFADDQCNYSIYLPKLVGKESRKTPMPIVFGVGHPIGCTLCMNNSGSWSFFATPTLIESGDLSTKNWQYKDEKGNLTNASNILNTKLALVTTRPTYEKQEQMMTEIEKKEKAVLASETYNISINACKRIVVPDEHKLKLALGFPEGYGPDDEGVTFKVYHFEKDGTAKEVDCIVTKLGLVVLCDDFSPYAVVAVEDKTAGSSKTKQAVVAYNENGTVTGTGLNNGVLTLAEGAETTLNITAKTGYKVEKVTVGGENVNIEKAVDTFTVKIKNGDVSETETNTYDIREGNGIIDVGFIEEEVVEEEEARNETIVNPELEAAEIEMPGTEETIVAGTTLELTPTVTSVVGENNISYQWYKTNSTTGAREAIEKEALGANGKEKTLRISEVEADDAGNYMLEATVTSIDGQTRTSISNPYTVNVETKSFIATVSKVGTEKIHPNSEFDVKVSISNFENIDKGIIIAGGELVYDSSVLELLSITGTNGWNARIDNGNETVSGLNGSKFIIDRENRGAEGDVFIAKFRAKTETTGTTVTLNNLETTEGDYLITPSTINPLTVVVERQTSSSVSFGNYKVEGDIVSRIRPKTTVSTFKNSISGGIAVIKDKNGNTLTDTQFIATGDKVSIGGKEYTVVVTGDIDGNREIGVNDLARLKLYYINLITNLSSIELKAADLNGDGRFTIVDLGQLKLLLVGLINEGDIKI